MKKANSSEGIPCGNESTSNCVTWQGGDISCLGIENGQTLSVSVKLAADRVCELMDTLDLTDLDLKCLFDVCISCPEPEKTLGTVLQLIINKVCTIQDAIEQLEGASGSGSDPLVKLATCFQFTNIDGDTVTELPLSTYVKRIASEVCDIKLTISSLENQISTLQDDIDEIKQDITDIQNASADNVSSDCLFVGTKDLPSAYETLDQAFCQIRTALGLTTDINTAMARQCDDLNTDYSSTPGWKLSPENLAQSINNLWLVVCDVLSRVTVIENTCCAVDCSDVKIGFSAIVNDTGDGITVRFTAGSGTSIPTGFTDAGSILTITDALGNVEDFAVTIENNGTEEITVTAIDLSAGNLELNLDAKLSNGSLVCEKCVNKTLTVSGCAICEISATGTDGASAVIIYETTGSTVVSIPSVPTTTTTSSTTTTTTTTAP